jgi:HEAT repeat protein
MNLPDAILLLRSKEMKERIRATQWLARPESVEVQELLLKVLETRSGYEASIAAEALGKTVEDDDALRRMVARFLYLSEDGKRRDGGCHIRAHLAYGFGQRRFQGAVTALRIGIRTVQIEPVGGVPFDVGAHLRANCALALGYMMAPDAVRDISLLLFEPNDLLQQKVGARKSAAQALGLTCDPHALVPLTLKLTYAENEAPDVLQECMQSLVQLEDPRAVEILTPYLSHSDRALAAHAALMIARTGDPSAAETLYSAIEQFSGEALQAVVLALASLRTENARSTLLRLADSWSMEVRLALVGVLTGTYAEEEQACLHRLAKSDSSSAVRRAAKEVLAL